MPLPFLPSALRRSDFGRYCYFLLSTGTFQTFRTWKRNGRANPFLGRDYREDMTTRSEILRLFFRDARSRTHH